EGVAAHFAKGAFARAQSAMEYLMTYGWAILIIAVVLSALFELGVFNSNNFAPKAPPGSCQVFRPNGPGTTSFINLEGVCNGELPEYVAAFNPSSTALSSGYGISNIYITSNDAPFAPVGTLNFTFSITAWIYPTQYGTCSGYCIVPIVSMGNNVNNGYLAFGPQLPSGLGIHGDGDPDVSTTGMNVIPLNTWTFISVTFNSSKEYRFQEDNQPPAIVNDRGFTDTPPIVIGSQEVCNGATFEGYITNVQLYNTALSSSDIQALYLEGIGGAPIDLQGLVAWYPLNGNANDYSGNGNNGQATGVTYTTNWWGGYTPP
ncbi:MAG: LamG-like jellyroll fold domain-containing protein, partial [Candidatus Micrarchaeaceae archaeon]